MKLKITVVIILLVIIVGVVFPTNVLGLDNGYLIENYYIDMIVNEDNTFDITETISVNFTNYKHGIYRKIPLENNVQRLDGTRSSNSAKITNVQISEKYEEFNEGLYKVIKIGDPNETIIGKHIYTIKYTYDIGKDPLRNADEFYFNLIGNEWDTCIERVDFSIKMPKSFDQTMLGFSSGNIYSADSSNISYTVEENTITGFTTDMLYPAEALTCRVTLPEGYFANTNNNFYYISIFQMIVSVVFVIIVYKLWKKYGNDEAIIETVEFYPPNDLNSSDIAYIYKGYSESKDHIALLIYLANKGYLRIEEEDEDLNYRKSKKFKIIKLKEYDGNNEAEKIFFEELFALKDEVTKEDLANKFYAILNRIAGDMNCRRNQEKIFEKPSLRKSGIIITMIVIVLLFMKGYMVINLAHLGILLASCPLIFLYKNPNRGIIVLSALFYVGMTFFFMAEDMLWNGIYIIEYIIESICLVSLIIFCGIIKKRNKYGNEILGRIKGFKNFLKIAEKTQLEQLVMENPEYFYHILPYTYVLGVSDVWMKNFEDIALKDPNWYHGTSNLSTNSFNNFMYSTYSSIASAMTSVSSGSGGGFGGGSGGGSSGGGSGGGGGGSW